MGLFSGNPRKKLQKQHEATLAEAMQRQRNGDIRGYSMLTEEAQQIYHKIQALDKV